MGSNIARFDTVRSIPIASITSSYTPLGAIFGHPMRILHFANDSNGTYMISFDGTTDNMPLLSSGFTLYDFTSDEDSTESFRIQNVTQVYIKYLVAPTSGANSNTVYLVAIYGRGE
jgi:hypothetical protein